MIYMSPSIALIINTPIICGKGLYKWPTDIQVWQTHSYFSSIVLPPPPPPYFGVFSDVYRNPLIEIQYRKGTNILFPLIMKHTDSPAYVCYVALRPKSTAMVMPGWSVYLTTLFPGQA